VSKKINKLNRTDLELFIQNNLPHLHKEYINLSVDLLTAKIVESVSLDSKVEIRGFGTFSKKYLKPRKFINPKTKEVSFLGETETIHFKPSRKLTKII